MGLRSIQRNIKKNNYSYLKDKEKMSVVAQKAEIFRNGITEKDLKEEFQKGYGAGWSDGRERLYKEVFAAICLVMEEDFDNDVIIDLLHAVDSRVKLSIDVNEDLDEVLERVGVELHFKNVIGGVEKT